MVKVRFRLEFETKIQSSEILTESHFERVIDFLGEISCFQCNTLHRSFLLLKNRLQLGAFQFVAWLVLNSNICQAIILSH